MLAVPLLLGVAASRSTAWQLVLAAAAVAGYLATASATHWLRTRRHGGDAVPLATYGLAFFVLGLVLVATHPSLLATLIVVAPAGAVTLRGTRAGRPRGLDVSLAEVAQALVLLPAAALLGPPVATTTVLRATLVAGLYLVGTVLVVRSVIRERDNAGFAAATVGYHAAVVLVEAVLLPWPYVVLASALTMRSAALPLLRRRWAGGPHPLRPVHVGLVEIVASASLVALAFVAPL